MQSLDKNSQLKQQNVGVDVNNFVEGQCPKPYLGEKTTGLRSVNSWPNVKLQDKLQYAAQKYFS